MAQTPALATIYAFLFDRLGLDYLPAGARQRAQG